MIRTMVAKPTLHLVALGCKTDDGKHHSCHGCRDQKEQAKLDDAPALKIKRLPYYSRHGAKLVRFSMENTIVGKVVSMFGKVDNASAENDQGGEEYSGRVADFQRDTRQCDRSKPAGSAFSYFPLHILRAAQRRISCSEGHDFSRAPRVPNLKAPWRLRWAVRATPCYEKRTSVAKATLAGDAVGATKVVPFPEHAATDDLPLQMRRRDISPVHIFPAAPL